MPQATIRKLFDSLDALERSIGLARKALDTRDPLPEQMLKRVEYYAEVLQKQRKLAYALVDHVAQQNWLEVTRHIKLINGLSALVHDDAKLLVTEIISQGRISGSGVFCS